MLAERIYNLVNFGNGLTNEDLECLAAQMDDRGVRDSIGPESVVKSARAAPTKQHSKPRRIKLREFDERFLPDLAQDSRVHGREHVQTVLYACEMLVNEWDSTSCTSKMVNV